MVRRDKGAGAGRRCGGRRRPSRRCRIERHQSQEVDNKHRCDEQNRLHAVRPDLGCGRTPPWLGRAGTARFCMCLAADKISTGLPFTHDLPFAPRLRDRSRTDSTLLPASSFLLTVQRPKENILHERLCIVGRKPRIPSGVGPQQPAVMSSGVKITWPLPAERICIPEPWPCPVRPRQVGNLRRVAARC